MCSEPRELSRPRVLAESVVVFGAPGLAIFLGVHLLVPWMVESGVELLFAWTLCVVGPTVLNGAAVAGLYVWRFRPDWPAFRNRFRLAAPSWKTVALVPVAAVGILVLNESLAWTVPLLRDVAWIPEAPITPTLFEDPYAAVESSETVEFMGVPLGPSAWWVAPFWIIFWLVFGVIGEEVVWRGYLLPLQEQAFGGWAWVLNGFLWNVPFHLYTLTAFFADMPFFLLLPLATQWLENTWFAVLVHSVLGSLALVLILPPIVA